jgi:hypothetical protein
LKLKSCSLILSPIGLIIPLFLATPQAWAAPAATATTLTITSGGSTVASGGSVASGSEVTLTATVVSGSINVTTGQVNFCDASATECTDIHLLGTAQLTGAGSAVLRFYPGIASHTYKAAFVGTPNGTPGYAGSTSSTATLTVSGAFPTATTIAASGSAGNYTLTATVTGVPNAPNLAAPAGTVSFLDTSNSNATLGTATLGTGSETFGFVHSSSPPTSAYPQSIAVADFNGDGKLDMAVPVYSIGGAAGDVSILLGNGDGTFTAGPSVPATGQNANNAAVADFDGDGNMDIALSLPDANEIQVVLGKGDGSFTALSPILLPGSYVYSVAAADLNGDGKPDLIATSCANQSLIILLGNGDGTFTQKSTPGVGGCPSSVGVGDFNGDGILDLAVPLNTDATGVASTVTILIGNGDGTFTQKAESPATGDNPLSVAVADFNGDGILDLAVANTFVDSGQPGTVTVLLGNGDGTFTPTSVSPATGMLPYSVAVGDVNGDGKADLVTSNVASNTFTVLLGKGDGTFAPPLSPAAGTDSLSVAVADFNGDGLADLAGADHYPNFTVTVQLSRLTQAATATATGISPSGTGNHLVEASYPGNSIYGSSVSATTSLAAVPTPSFTITGTADTITAGATTGNTSTITLTPADGFTGNVVLTATVTASPSGAVDPPTLSFGTTTPASLPPGSATLTISTTASSSAPCVSANQTRRDFPWYAKGGAVLACSLLFCIPARRRWRSLLGMVVLALVFGAGVLACGGATSTACPALTNSGTTAGAYTVTVTGTSGTLTETGTVSLTVQ